MNQNPQLRIKILEREVELLKEELYKAELKNDELRKLVGSINSVKFPLEWGLTAKETKLIELLAKHELVTRSAAMSYVYELRYDDLPNAKIIDVFLVRVREKLRAASTPIEVHTAHGRGYYIDAAARTYLKQFF